MIYFVTEAFIKDKTHLTQNVDAGDIAPYIPMAVKTYAQPILGYNFTEDLLTKYNAGTTSSDEDELIEKIQYFVAFYAAYDAVPNLSFRISNKGVQSQFGDYSASEGITTVEYIRNNIKKFVDTYENMLRKWLEENEDLFPLYKSETNKEIEGPDEQDDIKSDVTWL